ncbi:MAG: hypothetical protein RIA69_04410 [Cyclobacteriaceae bacterium]
MKNSNVFVLLLFSILCIQSCSDLKKTENNEKIRRQTIGKGDITASEQTLLTVKIGTPITAIDISEHHLHGRFFEDRAEFFVVEQPQLYLSDTKVNELTLYFIDGILCKKKYALDDDISYDLMRSYGTFKFRALNDSSKKVSKREGILKKISGKKLMNENLTYYRMKWPEQQPMLYYEYQRDSASENKLLIEELEAYKNLLREAERSI